MAELHKNYIERDEDASYRAYRFTSALEMFEPKRGLLLDVGCNDALLKDILSSSIEYVGIDVSISGVRKANKKGTEVLRGDVKHLPFKQAAFDFLFCIEVIEHVPKVRNAMREMRRVLKTGGFLFISVPNLVNLMNRLLILVGKASYSTLRENHFHQYTPKSFDDFLETCGFKIVDRGRLTVHPILNKPIGKVISILLPISMHALILRRAIKI